MTLFQKEQIKRMRSEGMGYFKIAACLSIPENTIKSYCRRNSLGGVISVSTTQQKNNTYERNFFCKNCGKQLENRPCIKPRKFCSDECRRKWWNAHPDQIVKKAIYHLECACCGRAFESYGNRTRKYCTHACYIKYRFIKPVQMETGDRYDTRTIRA